MQKTGQERACCFQGNHRQTINTTEPIADYHLRPSVLHDTCNLAACVLFHIRHLRRHPEKANKARRAWEFHGQWIGTFAVQRKQTLGYVCTVDESLPLLGSGLPFPFAGAVESSLANPPRTNAERRKVKQSLSYPATHDCAAQVWSLYVPSLVPCDRGCE